MYGYSVEDFVYLFIYLIILILERKEWRDGQREKHRFVVPPISVFIGCFWCVPCQKIKSTTLEYGDDALTN